MDVTEQEREQMIIEAATRLIELAESVKNRDHIENLLIRVRRLDNAWYRIEVVS